ncbi:MAG: DUF2157 domain-containing protein [Chloroflexota bacterium]|nr:DUF2157 domain-containing protein [Chloroflexota bacterium]MDE2968854.1 DUF2157 domain-containing protein [Chloroflexota bacterium]
MNPIDASNHRFVSRLREEVEAWQQDGTVTAEQAQAILARYPDYEPGFEASRRRQGLVTGLSILGGILIGLSVITFFAANWDEISRSVKLGSLIIGVLLSYGAGYVIWQRSGPTPYAVAFVLLGCIIYGAGVHLIGQIYHVPVNDPNLSLFWFLGVAPLAYVTRSRPVMFLAVVLFLAAVGFRQQEWLEGLDESEAGIAGLILYVALGAFLFAVGKAKAHLDGWQSIGGLFQALGLLTAFAALYILTFRDVFDDVDSISGASLGYWALASGASAVAVATLAWLAWQRAQAGDKSPLVFAEAGAVAVLLVTALTAGLVPVDWEPLYPIVFNALFALLALGLMASGYLQEHEGRVNLSLAIIALYVITRYFEYSISLLDSSLVFFGAGVILLGGGYLLDRGRRRMLVAMREREGAP